MRRRSVPSNEGSHASVTEGGRSRAGSPTRSARADSAMPVVRSTRERTTGAAPGAFASASAIRCRRRGITSCSRRPRISAGTPGRRTTTRPSRSSSQRPGAVPHWFSRTVAPSGTSACERFDSGIRAMPRRRYRSSRCASIAGSWRRDLPSTSATARLVRSSRVGPSAPDTMRRPVRPSAARTASRMGSWSSGTEVRRRTRTPAAASARPRSAALVSTVSPSTSSVPTVRSSPSTYRSADRKRAR